jgi:NADH-quinone oxidoreductase subunit L
LEQPSSYNPATVEVLILLSLLLPLFSSLLAFTIREGYAWIISAIAPILLFASSICAVYVSFLIQDGAPFIIDFNWFSFSGGNFTAALTLDAQSRILLPVVTVVSFLVHLYSAGYMAGDAGIRRYFAMLGFFTFSMLGIVLSNNLLLIFVSWELVGFSSYMLIGHWREKPEAAAAAKKSFIINRIGDAGFLIGLMIVWASTGTFHLPGIFQHTESASWQTAAALCIFCGVIGKSAQFPLLTWLPDAMEGPTPVSALIHAATMVAAGIYLLVRVFPIFTPEALDVVIIIGILTALIGALAAVAQDDLKKILAYSTISQLGLMTAAIGAGSPDAALLHLFTHAFFKAGLFLCAGAVIHALHQAQHQSHVHFDVQNIRNLGGLKKKLPFTFLMFIICGSALAGIPFFSGFLSKEAILTSILQWQEQGPAWRWIFVILAFVISFLTVLYIFRLIWTVFAGREERTGTLTIAEPPVIMRIPMAILAAASLWLIVSWNPVGLSGWITGSSRDHNIFLTVFSSLWVIIGVLAAYFIYRKRKLVRSEVLLNNFYLDQFYHRAVTRPSLQVAVITERFDKKWIDGFLHATAYAQVTLAHFTGWFDRAIVDGTVKAMVSLTRSIGSFTRSFQGGKIQLYIFWAVFAIIIFLIWALI